MSGSEQTYFQKGFNLKKVVGPVLAQSYHSKVVDRLKELGAGALLPRLRSAGAELLTTTPALLGALAYGDRDDGIVIVATEPASDLARLSLPECPLVAVVEQVEKPGNLGTMLRTAEAAGAAAVVVCDPATDPFNPNVVRASLGTLFTIPLVVGDTPGAIARLRSLGIRTVATTPSASLPHWGADLTGPVAVVVGSEQYGLSAAWLEAADQRVVIPMPGSVDSLNTAMAAGIVLFEAVRQRGITPA